VVERRLRIVGAVARDLDAARFAANSVGELAQRRSCPAARIEQSHRLPRRVPRRTNQRPDTLEDRRQRRVVASFSYAL